MRRGGRGAFPRSVAAHADGRRSGFAGPALGRCSGPSGSRRASLSARTIFLPIPRAAFVSIRVLYSRQHARGRDIGALPLRGPWELARWGGVGGP